METIGGLLIAGIAGFAFWTWTDRRFSSQQAELESLREIVDRLSDVQELMRDVLIHRTNEVTELRLPQFGPYATLLTSYPFPDLRGPLYLRLLNLTDARQVVELVYNTQLALHNVDRLEPAIHGLLSRRFWEDQLSWEPHLVAAVAIITNHERSSIPASTFDLLWSRVDEGNYVAEQLLIAASIADPNFSKQATQRIRAPEPHPHRSYLLILMSQQPSEKDMLTDKETQALDHMRARSASFAVLPWQDDLLALIHDIQAEHRELGITEAT